MMKVCLLDILDADGSSALDLIELEALLSSWGIPQNEAVKFSKARHDD